MADRCTNMNAAGERCLNKAPHPGKRHLWDNREHGASDGPTPCFCAGPWRDIDPADRPDTVLAREHALGGPGCEPMTLSKRIAAAPKRCQWVARCTNVAVQTVTYRQPWTSYRSGPWRICADCLAGALSRGDDVERAPMA